MNEEEKNTLASLTDLVRKDIGQLPIWRKDDWVQGASVHQWNYYRYLNSMFVCLAEGNTNAPGKVVDGSLVANEGWKVVFDGHASVSKADAAAAAATSAATAAKTYTDGAEARIKSLEDGKAATDYVDGKNLTVAEAIVSLAARLDALEGSRGLLGDATAGTLDAMGLTRCRYPLVMLGHGVPAEANVPDNLPDGLPWDGVPAFAGQQYVNLEAASGGLYYAVGNENVSDWKQA